MIKRTKLRQFGKYFVLLFITAAIRTSAQQIGLRLGAVPVILLFSAAMALGYRWSRKERKVQAVMDNLRKSGIVSDKNTQILYANYKAGIISMSDEEAKELEKKLGAICVEDHKEYIDAKGNRRAPKAYDKPSGVDVTLRRKR